MNNLLSVAGLALFANAVETEQYGYGAPGCPDTSKWEHFDTPEY